MKTGGFCHDKYRRDFVETEVLAPAGSIEGLKAALYAGADAVIQEAECLVRGRMQTICLMKSCQNASITVICTIKNYI